ncbi:methylenetetrahydrofolate reductase [NAD(P)H] [Reichenbachiella versicolor]|uniref:methylenetetrahydrofolate reductase [NAD(P)H] n=1 Tax=Reichenbachiella versicolor TaxID=1821036 RepID=UPI000D6E6D3A|nr:methylenetetrahydrofolate reductase [NAD(P)H] [Reichenbachiella versicolor]
MKVTEHISNAKNTLFSLEIIPPKKGESIRNIYDHLDPLMEFKPPFIDVTYHREEYVYKELSNGLLEKKITRKRPGTVGICAALKHKYGIDPVPHIICGGFTREETENALIDLNFLGIDNVLVLRGDAIKSEGRFIPTEGGNNYAIDLLHQVNDLNTGKYLEEDLENPNPTDFCIGVAGYPEKHFEAPNLQTDLQRLKDKVDAGAEYIVTQMFFDNDKFFKFVEECKAVGINVPIIPGLKPISTKSQATVLPSIFHLDMPEELAKELLACKDNKAAREIGVEWGVKQSKELKEAGVPVLHYYSMGKSTSVQRIAEQVF